MSDKLNSILSLSKEEAERLTHSEVTAEHLLLGMLRDGHNKAVELLSGMGVNLSELRTRLESVQNTSDAGADKVPIEKIVLSVAVLAILITAPLGAIGIDMTSQKVLKREEI